jgi:hypothetical protein
MIPLLSAATRIACGQLTPQHLNALHASVERASCLSARHDWERKATAHAELFTMLGDLTGDCDLARLVSSAAGRLQDLVMTVGPAADGIILSSRRRLLRELGAVLAEATAITYQRPRRARPDRPGRTSGRSRPPTGPPRWGRRRRQGAPRSPPVLL